MVYTNRARNGRILNWHQHYRQLNSAVNSSVDMQNVLCKAAIAHSESHATRAQWVCTEAENSAIVATAVTNRAATALDKCTYKT